MNHAWITIDLLAGVAALTWAAVALLVFPALAELVHPTIAGGFALAAFGRWYSERPRPAK